MPRHSITPKRYAVEYRLPVTDTPGESGSVSWEVRVAPADMLRAEETGPRFGITNPQTQAIAITLMWLWAASVREGHTNAAWPDFRANVVDFEKIGEAAVDPTRPGASTPSPSPSPPPASGDSTSTGGYLSSVPTNDS